MLRSPRPWRPDVTDDLVDALFDPADEDVVTGTLTPEDGAPFDILVRFREAVVHRQVMEEGFVVRTVQAMVPRREMRDARAGSTLQVMGSRYLVSSVQTDFAVAGFLDLQGPLP